MTASCGLEVGLQPDTAPAIGLPPWTSRPRCCHGLALSCRVMTCSRRRHIITPYALNQPLRGSPFNMVIFAQEAWLSRRGARADMAYVPAAFSWGRVDASGIATDRPMTPTHSTRSQTPGRRGRDTVPRAGREAPSSSRQRSGRFPRTSQRSKPRHCPTCGHGGSAKPLGASPSRYPPPAPGNTSTTRPGGPPRYAAHTTTSW